MKIFDVVRIKTDGASTHRVYVASKQAAQELVWSDSKKELGRFIYTVS